MSDLTTGVEGRAEGRAEGGPDDFPSAPGTAPTAAVYFTGSRLPYSLSLMGDALYLRHQESALSAFTFDSQSAAARRPDGSLSALDVDAVNPGTAVQAFQSLLAEPAAGEYRVQWQFNIGAQTIVRDDHYFVSFNDLYGQVRSLLGVDDTLVKDQDVDYAVIQVVAMLTASDVYGAALPSYSLVPQADRTLFDRAVAFMAAAMMRPYTPKQQSTGELVGWVSGTDEYKWSAPPKPDEVCTIEDQWVEQAFNLFASTSVLGPSLRDIQSRAHAFAAVGRTRSMRALWPAQPAPCGGFDLYWNAWGRAGGCTSWSWSK